MENNKFTLQTNLNLNRNGEQFFEQLRAGLRTFRRETGQMPEIYVKTPAKQRILQAVSAIIRKFLPAAADSIEILMKIAGRICPEG